MNSKALWSAGILASAAALFSACGDGDSTKIKVCNAKQVTCLNEQGGQVCSADATVNLPFSCAEGTHCCDPKAKGADCGEDVTAASCVGDCTPGATQCGSTGVSLRCSEDGRRWVATDCPVGTGCDDGSPASDTYGTCVHSDDTPSVVVCNQGDATCADAHTAKTCETDGSNWVYTACATNELCNKGACELDPAKGCVPHSGSCEDLTHVKLCNDDGDGYEKTVTCPKSTTCEDGACQGPVCPIGAIRCDDVRVGSSFVNAVANGLYQPQSVYRCNDAGTAWEISSCGSNEICVYDNISRSTVDKYVSELLAAFNGISYTGSLPTLVVPDSSHGSCQTPECASPFALRNLSSSTLNLTAGSFTCGDGNEPGEDPLASFSLCEGLPPFNNLYWSNYTCPDGQQCTYEGSPAGSGVTGPRCASSCSPGATACYTAPTGTVGLVSTSGEGTITCGKDGTWDYSTADKCWSNDNKSRELWCGPTLMGTESQYNLGACMEPACAAWFAAYDTFTLPENVGACGTDGKFYPCMPDGSFGDAEDCGQCRVATSNELPLASSAPETYAGYDPGTCQTCVEGSQRCVFAGGNGHTPYYQVCTDQGVWSTKSCSGGKLCWDYVEDSGLASILCGAECAPNTAVCGGIGGTQIAECDDNGNQGDFKDCPTGACHSDNRNGSEGGGAYCEAECITGTALCTTAPDPDNADTYAPAAIACTSKGRYDYKNPAKICNWTDPQNPERCVTKLGCVECDPGTFSGTPEVRCAVDESGLAVDPPSVQVCKDGHWDKPVTCPGSGTSCVSGVCAYSEPSGGEGGGGGQAGGGGQSN